MILAQNIQEIWDTVKRPNLKMIGTEGEETQVKGTGNAFNKSQKKNFPNLKKDIYQSISGIQNTKQHGPEKKVPWIHNDHLITE